MKKYCYYFGGIIQPAVSSKGIARMLVRGELSPEDKVLDMDTRLWVPVNKQSDIMRIAVGTINRQKKSSLWEQLGRESFNDERESLVDPLIPETRTGCLLPFWSGEQYFYWELRVFHGIKRFIRAIYRWRYDDD